MSGVIPPLPQYAFMAQCIVKHRDNFTFTLISLSNDLNLRYIHAVFIAPTIKPTQHFVGGWMKDSLGKSVR
jgi:hypothetical protein